ncbi:uncharacterized protein J7T54_002021 [Emericellopsis cladophorae]|uniref:Splicing factor YJU2 n=1 Tax=Emericellopsis cladophorae TaxID=2686198 RepID=A0A9P9Y3K8_9HYPO|nr:uncharacterized protein J7T54_002021 [Emericellopsis cladophorae]KAI6782862.1 hypothetical protein J7T54_002021 [Emericellopsis cladophorae]
MSERKVLQKYYPPDFDPAALGRRRGPKQSGPKVQTVRLMAPFAISRKETPPDEKYLGIQIFRFYIRCTRCSAEIIFRTDPKIHDYTMVKGAVRNHEPWRNREAEEESTDERLDRLAREEAEEAGDEEKNAMAELEAKNEDAKREMAAADALDEIRQRNARIHRSEKEGMDFADTIVRAEDEERERLEAEDEAAAKAAFAARRAQVEIDEVPEHLEATSDASSSSAPIPGSDEALMPPPPAPAAVVKTPVEGAAATAPTFKRVVKKKKDHSAMLGIKKKPSLV